MARFKAAATQQLRLLVVVLYFLLCNASSFRVLPPDPANACATDLYVRASRTQPYILGIVFAAGMLLIKVIMEVNTAEAGADATDKAIKGIASVAAGWKRAALSGMYLLAVGLSATAFFLAIAACEDGYRYRTGCTAAAAWMGYSSFEGVLLMVAMALLHGEIAWVAAVSQN